jgi:putative SOS response-associated peptidase YedK
MCGRFVVSHTPDELVQRFILDAVLVAPTPSYNIAPTQQVPVVLQKGERVLDSFRWGLVPFWAKDLKIGAKLINARMETVAEKPSFKNALKARRCVLPASGYYEWVRINGDKIPHFIHSDDGRPLAFAGLWERWKSPEGEEVKSCTIITREADAGMSELHHRMPAMFDDEEKMNIWFDDRADDPEELVDLLQGAAGPGMSYYPVSTQVNKVANDFPDLAEQKK